MEIRVNITKVHFWILLSTIVLLGAGIFAYAQATQKPNPGHSISEIFGGIFGQPIKLASGSYLAVQGSGDEQVYIGGDAVANDIQLGSFNPNIQKVALWNAGSGNFMDLYVRKIYPTQPNIYTDFNDCYWTGRGNKGGGSCASNCKSGYVLVRIAYSNVKDNTDCKCCRIRIG